MTCLENVLDHKISGSPFEFGSGNANGDIFSILIGYAPNPNTYILFHTGATNNKKHFGVTKMAYMYQMWYEWRFQVEQQGEIRQTDTAKISLSKDFEKA